MSDGAAQSGTYRVGYILKQYPRLSETFILNEILGLERGGVGVSVFSLRHATEGRFHPAVGAVEAHVHYVAEPNKVSFLAALRALPELQSDRLPEVLRFIDRLPVERRAGLVLQAVDVARMVVEQHIAHLHAHFMTVAAHTAHLVSLLTGVSYTVTAHAKDIYRHTVDWEVAQIIASSASAVITVCDANLHFLSHRLDGTDAELVRIYNGLDPQEQPPTSPRREPGLVIGVGRLVEKKGFDVLLDAVALLRSKQPSLRCVLIGDGDERGALEARAVRLGIDDVVQFTGALSQDKVGGWLRQAQLIVAPCRVGADGNQDALPTVLLEALDAGLPAIATSVAGIPEIITNGIEGLIVEHADVESIATAIDRLLNDENMRLRMSAAGPVKLASRFDRRRSIEQLVDTFRARELV